MSSQEIKSDDPRQVEAFRSKYGLVVHAAQRFAPDPDLIPDIVQQVFLEFIQNSEKRQWDIDGDINGLLYRITQNVCANLWRTRRKESPEAIRQIGEYLLQLNQQRAEQEKPEEITDETVDEFRALQECLARLPEKSRRIIDMRYFLDMPTREIAEELHMEQGTVRKTVARIRQRLRKCIERTLQLQGKKYEP